MARSHRTCLLPALAVLVAGCAGQVPLPAEPDLSATLIARKDDTPPARPEGACWTGTDLPAVVETVTDQRQTEAPPGDPAIFRTETRQVIVAERRSVWVRTPCPEVLTPDLMASLQRALQVRGVYDGPVTGVMDPPTGRAVRAWQRPRGLDSDVLALATAQALGLVPGVF